jgi:hypothetical protein
MLPAQTFEVVTTLTLLKLKSTEGLDMDKNMNKSISSERSMTL